MVCMSKDVVWHFHQYSHMASYISEKKQQKNNKNKKQKQTNKKKKNTEAKGLGTLLDQLALYTKPLKPYKFIAVKGTPYMLYQFPKSKILIIARLPPGPKYHFILFYSQPFSNYWSYWDKCTELPQNNLKH